MSIPGPWDPTVIRIAEAAAAREALAPLRELHKPVEVWEYDDTNGVWVHDEHGEKIVVEKVCAECSTDSFMERVGDCEWYPGDECAVQWPRSTARLIYPSEEL